MARRGALNSFWTRDEQMLVDRFVKALVAGRYRIGEFRGRNKELLISDARPTRRAGGSSMFGSRLTATESVSQRRAVPVPLVKRPEMGIISGQTKGKDIMTK